MAGPSIEFDPAFMMDMVRFTKAFDMTGSPTIALPVGFTKSGLPIGFQLVGPHLSEDMPCRAGHTSQHATDWHKRNPDLPSPLLGNLLVLIMHICIEERLDAATDDNINR